ncbi:MULTISPECIES: hypothetical protein [Aquitalea]|nr:MULTISPECIES: hypothetical protein [Aquitalea]
MQSRRKIHQRSASPEDKLRHGRQTRILHRATSFADAAIPVLLCRLQQ